MGRLRELLPIINIFEWADGDKYTIEEDTTVLPPVLAEHDQKTDADWNKHKGSQQAQSKSRKTKKIEGITVEKTQLNKEKATSQGNVQRTNNKESSKEKEIGE